MLNWRSFLALVAIVIVSATIFYSQYLSGKIAADERQKVALWVSASKAILSNPGMDLTLPNLIRNGDFELPLTTNDWTISANHAGSGITTGLSQSGAASLHVTASSGGTTLASSIWQAACPGQRAASRHPGCR